MFLSWLRSLQNRFGVDKRRRRRTATKKDRPGIKLWVEALEDRALLAARDFFAASVDYATGANPNRAALGDLNGDGHADLVIANSSNDTVSVRLGNGQGSFGAKTDYAVGSNPVGVALGDVDGDGHLDIVVDNDFSGSVSVL